MIVTYQFDTGIEEHVQELDEVIKAKRMALLISEVRQELFRPARKHGYNDLAIQTILDKCGEDGINLIELLETRWSQMLESYNLED